MHLYFAVLCHPSSSGLDRSNFNLGATHLPWPGRSRPAWNASVSHRELFWHLIYTNESVHPVNPVNPVNPANVFVRSDHVAWQCWTVPSKTQSTAQLCSATNRALSSPSIFSLRLSLALFRTSASHNLLFWHKEIATKSASCTLSKRQALLHIHHKADVCCAAKVLLVSGCPKGTNNNPMIILTKRRTTKITFVWISDEWNSVLDPCYWEI